MFQAKQATEAAAQWIRDWFEQNGKGCNAVIGISGGKDSSVVAALCVEALGKERVIGVLMPNGEQPDIDCSKQLVAYLGIPYFVSERNVALFTSHGVYTEREMHSRLEILLKSYCNLINIEAKTMADMAKKEILPAVSEYSQLLASTILSKKSVCEDLDCTYEREMLEEISSLTAEAYKQVKALEKALAAGKKCADARTLANHYKDKVLPIMKKLRIAADGLENVVSEEYWPMPTYGDLLFDI